MISTCPRCGTYYGPFHECTYPSYYVPAPPIFYPYPTPKGCAQCGSTAVDHTEAECLRNRQLTPIKPKDNPDGN